MIVRRKMRQEMMTDRHSLPEGEREKMRLCASNCVPQKIESASRNKGPCVSNVALLCVRDDVEVRKNASQSIFNSAFEFSNEDIDAF